MKNKTILAAIAALFISASVSAQESGMPDYKQLRTNSWSLYGQIGLGWGVGVPYANENASKWLNTYPMFGGGVNFNIRPWIRLGVNYKWSKLNRDQRYSDIIPVNYAGNSNSFNAVPWTSVEGGKAYSNYRLPHHDVDLTVEFNIAEIWKNRQSQWFNMYLGVGAGYMFTSGRVYTMSMGTAQWQDPNNYVNGNVQVANNWKEASWVTADNATFNADGWYIPAVLNIEFDVNPSWTLGLKGEYDFLIKRKEMAPKGIAYAAATVRYNFSGHKHGWKARYKNAKAACETEKAQMNDEINALRAQLANCDRDCPDKLRKALAENEKLRRQLKEAEDKLNRLTKKGMTVYFDNMKYNVKDEYMKPLAEVAELIKSHPGVNVQIVGEANATGTKKLNQRLSEQRMAEVVRILIANGLTYEQITNTNAIGASSGIKDPKARRVTITVAE